MVKILRYALLSGLLTAILLIIYKTYMYQTIGIAYLYTYYVFYLNWKVGLVIVLFAFFLGGAIATLFKRYSFLIAPCIVALILFLLSYPSEPGAPRRYIQWEYG